MNAARHSPILRAAAAAFFSVVVFNPLPLRATVLTWTGAYGGFWNTPPPPGPTNWIPNNLTPATTADDADLIFTGSRNTNTVNDQPVGTTFLQNISFDRKASEFSLSGNNITIEAGSILNLSKKRQVLSFSNDPIAGAPGRFAGIRLSSFAFNQGGIIVPLIRMTAKRGDILITSDVAFVFGAVTLIIDGSHNLTMTGSLFDVPDVGFLGAGSIVKNGKGTLLLTGRSTYPGDTTVNKGKLIVNGSIASVNTFVNPGGTLGGSGFIFGNVINSGNVNPGNSPGTLTVNNYTQNGNGTLTIEFSGKKHDRLAVQGAAFLKGDLRLVTLGQGPRLRFGEKVTILSANQGIHGEFDKVKSVTGGIVQFGVSYEGDRVSVRPEATFGKFADKSGLSPNQRAVAGGLDKVAFRNKQPKLLDSLLRQSIDDLPSDFDRIAPDELASIFNISTALANVQTTNLQRRTADIRSGANGFSASGLAMQGSGPGYAGSIQFRTGAAGPTGYGGKESKEMKEVAPVDNRWGAFLTGVGEWVDVNGDGNARGYDITTGGFTLGVDYKFTPNVAVGVSAGYAGTGAHLANNGRVFVNGGKLGIYGTYFDGGFYVDTAVNGGYNSYDTRRTALNGDARGSTDGGELNVLLGTGYDWKIGALSIGPTANFQYTYVGLDSFTERGGLAPLTIGSQHGESLRTAIGFKTTYDWRVGGVIIKPELRAAWQHEYGDASFDVASSFANGGGNLFTVRGPEVGRDSLLLGAGFAILWNERTSTYVYYDGELLRNRYDSHSVSGGVRVTF